MEEAGKQKRCLYVWGRKKKARMSKRKKNNKLKTSERKKETHTSESHGELQDKKMFA